MGSPTREPIIVMRTGLAPVVAGGSSPGWVSGNPANLAGNAVSVQLFDLGPDWDQYSFAQICIVSTGPSSGLDQINFGSRSTGVAALLDNRLRDIGAAQGTISYSALTTANGYGVWIVRPMGRYLLVSVRNADATNAQGAGTFTTVAAYVN